MIQLATYDFNKYLKEILKFSNDDATYNEFIFRYNKLESIVNSKIGPDGISIILEDEKYLNSLKYILDLYDKAPIDFEYSHVARYVMDLSKIYGERITGNLIINNFYDVYTLYDNLKKESINSLKLDSEVLLNVYRESLRMVLLSYKKDLEKVHGLRWYVKTILQDYLCALSIDNYVKDPRLIDDVKRFIGEEEIVMPYYTKRKTHKNIIEEFDEYTKNLIMTSNVNSNNGPKI